MIENPGFETGNIDGWQLDVRVEGWGGTSTKGRGTSHFSGRLGGGDLTLKQTIDNLSPHTTYKISSYVYNWSEDQGVAVVGVSNYGGDTVSQSVAHTDWAPVELTFTTGNSTGADFFIQNTNFNTWLRIDDVQIEPLPLEIINGDFESGLNHWNTWQNVTTSRSHEYAGDIALQLTGASSANQVLQVKPNTSYTISGYVKVEDPNNEKVVFGVNDVTDDKNTSITNINIYDTQYTLHQMTFRTGLNTDSIKVYLWRPDLGERGAYLDNVTITENCTSCLMVIDSDHDSIADPLDKCPNTLPDSLVDDSGCIVITDNDKDGITDNTDVCPNTPLGSMVDERGCVIVLDSDNDGVNDAIDVCPNTPLGSMIDDRGCAIVLDSDNDGVNDDVDVCPNTLLGSMIDERGCAIVLDSDNDGVNDDIDVCLNTPAGAIVDSFGCQNTFMARISNAFDRSFDTSAGNSGNATARFNSGNVDLEISQDVNTAGSNWLNVGYIEQGEWLEYDNVSILEAGSYLLKARIASATGDGGLSLTFAGSTVTNNNLPSTDGWQAWQTVEVGTINVESAGQYTLRVDMNQGGFNLNYIELEPVQGCTEPSCMDSDNDDQCENTAQGVNIDATGCEIIEENNVCGSISVYPNWSTPDWEGGPNTHHESNDEMVYQGQLYAANWYTSSIPGSDETWRYVGSCSN